MLRLLCHCGYTFRTVGQDFDEIAVVARPWQPATRSQTGQLQEEAEREIFREVDEVDKCKSRCDRGDCYVR